MKIKQVTLTISGKVQGVFYRQNTKKLAESLNLTGYVQNNNDNTVTIVAQGKEKECQSHMIMS